MQTNAKCNLLIDGDLKFHTFNFSLVPNILKCNSFHPGLPLCHLLCTATVLECSYELLEALTLQFHLRESVFYF